MWPFVTHFVHSVSCFWRSSMTWHVNVHFWAEIHRICEVCAGEIIVTYYTYLWVHIHFTSHFHLEWKGNPNCTVKDPHFHHLPTCHLAPPDPAFTPPPKKVYTLFLKVYMSLIFEFNYYQVHFLELLVNCKVLAVIKEAFLS